MCWLLLNSSSPNKLYKHLTMSKMYMATDILQVLRICVNYANKTNIIAVNIIHVATLF